MDYGQVIERIRSLIPYRGRAAFARRSGIPRSTLDGIATGQRGLSLWNAALICRAAGVSLDWLAWGDTHAAEPKVVVVAPSDLSSAMAEVGEPEEIFETIPYMEDSAAAGPFLTVHDERLRGFLRIPRSLLGKAGRWAGVRISGDSMSPTLQPGDVALVNFDDREPTALVGHVVLAKSEDGVTVKRLGDGGRVWLLKPDNLAWGEPIVVPKGRQNPIVGAVRALVWRDMRPGRRTEGTRKV